MLTVQTPPASTFFDSHAFVQSSSPTALNITTVGKLSTYFGHLTEYQYRIGGKYWPNTPVQCGYATSNGAAAAYIELAKAFNFIGDSTMMTGINPARWCQPTYTGGSMEVINNCMDWRANTSDGNTTTTRDATDFFGPSAFIIAASLETSAGGEISGLNGEEQNDIQLNIKYSTAQDPAANFHTFVQCDNLLVLRENNLVELIK